MLPRVFLYYVHAYGIPCKCGHPSIAIVIIKHSCVTLLTVLSVAHACSIIIV